MLLVAKLPIYWRNYVGTYRNAPGEHLIKAPKNPLRAGFPPDAESVIFLVSTHLVST